MLDNIPEISCVNQLTPVSVKTRDEKKEKNLETCTESQPVQEVSSTTDKMKSVRFSNPTDHEYDLSKLIHNHMLRTSIVYRDSHSHDIEKNCGGKRCCCVPRAVIIILLSLILCLGVVGMTLGVLHSQGIIKLPISNMDPELNVKATTSRSIMISNHNKHALEISMSSTESVFVESVESLPTESIKSQPIGSVESSTTTESFFTTQPADSKQLASKSRLDTIFQLLTIEGPLQKYSYNKIV